MKLLALILGLAVLFLSSCGQENSTSGSPGSAETPSTSANPIAETPSDSPPGIPMLSGNMPSSISKSRPPAMPNPGVKADFDGLAKVIEAGDGAIGKTVAFSGYITLAAPLGQPIHIGDCTHPPGKLYLFEGIYNGEQAPFVRAMPSSEIGATCPIIHAQIDEIVPSFKRPRGKILGIYDISPDPAPTSLPDGVDYISMDDALFAGAKAVGKVVDVAVYRSNGRDVNGEKTYLLYTQSCSAHGGVNAHFKVVENASNRELIEGIPNSSLDGCQRLRFRLTEPPSAALPNGFGALIIGQGARLDHPTPRPNP